MSRRIKECQQQRCKAEPFITWTPDPTSRKRKRQDSETQKTDVSNEQCQRQPPDEEISNEMQTISPHMLSELSLADDTPQDLPELTYSEPTSPPNIDELYLDELKDLPATEPDKCEILSPNDDALFSQFLRFPSPPGFSAKGPGDNNHGSTKTVSPPETCLIKNNSYSADHMDHNAVRPDDGSVKVKPRITLRIKPQSESKPKPKITLRLGSQKSVHQATKKVKLHVDGRKRRCI